MHSYPTRTEDPWTTRLPEWGGSRCRNPMVSILHRIDEATTKSQKTDRDPGDRGHDGEGNDERADIRPDPPQRVIRRHAAYRASAVIADAKGRRKETDSHRQDNDHCIVHLVHTHRLGHR